MRVIISIVLLFLSINCIGQISEAEIVSNETIIKLKKAGLGKEVLLSKIQNAKCNFDLSTEGIIKLKNAGIEDEVIAAMLNKAPSVKSKEENQTTENNDLDPGLYYFKGTPCKYIELEASVYSQANSGSGILTGMTYGIAKTKMKATLSGDKSNFVIENKPANEFYFVFDKSNNNFSNNSIQSVWFSAATSPNEFILVKFSLSSNKKNREVVTGSWNSYQGMTTGIDDKYKVSFKFERISKGYYRVFFENPLEKGQYCFMYAGGSATYGNAPMQKVYDFGIE